MSTHYVDNKKLFQEMKDYRSRVLVYKESGGTKPIIPKYIGECILLIANRLSLKPNFVNYSYREEMVSDGIENCISYIDNFNPEKSDNPFAYFTQIIYYAFLRRIAKEHKQLYVRHKIIENSMILNQLAEQHGADETEVYTPPIEFDNDNMFDFIKTFEDNISKKKVKRQRGVEKFLEEDHE